MKVDGKSYRTIWLEPDGRSVGIIDQTRLPHEFAIRRVTSADEMAQAIRTMQVRGAPLIGVSGAYGLALAARQDPTDAALTAAHARLLVARPTAVNLRWALDDVLGLLRNTPLERRAAAAFRRAADLAEDDVATCRAIGEHGAGLITAAWHRKNEAGDTAPRVEVLTHCNAGWLATVDYGTALSPIYVAHDEGVPLHVWVDETRPRNQGASLTAWELGRHGVPFTVIADNAGGHLMQAGRVDLCLVGTDRTTRTGDVCNKIGTYLKALAARDNDVPFYVALPHSTIDWTMTDGRAIPIEERDSREVTHMTGRAPDGALVSVQLVPDGSQAANHAFDVTPARLVSGLITERGVCAASELGLLSLYPERKAEVAR